MEHCSSDPKLEVLPSPLSFSLFFGLYVSPAYSLVFFDFEGLVVACIVRVWRQRGLQGCLDTDWIHSFIIRQIGWSRCGLCKSRTGSCSEPIPFLPHPTVKSTETLCVLDALGQKKDHSSSFSLSDLYWGVGLFCPEADTHRI